LVSATIYGFVHDRTTSKPQPPSHVIGFVGGCDRFRVFAQNRWMPYGATRRVAPDPKADANGNFDPNQLISINGYVRTQAAYPTNPPPFNSDVWFHVADDSGWVPLAAVRAQPTTQDPTGLDAFGGQPVPLAEDCAGTNR
jgi:hypothetical protein